MSPNDFCLWLSGCLDILEAKTLNTKQVEMIKEKLTTVDGHAKPSIETISPAYTETSPQSKEIYIPFPTPHIPHPDLGPYPTWQDKNPSWSGIKGQTTSVQTVLSPPGITVDFDKQSIITANYNKNYNREF